MADDLDYLLFQFLNGTIGVFSCSFSKLIDSLFQFLNGTIGVQVLHLIVVLRGIFQFLNGTIGVTNLKMQTTKKIYFNS